MTLERDLRYIKEKENEKSSVILKLNNFVINKKIMSQTQSRPRKIIFLESEISLQIKPKRLVITVY